MVFGKQVKDKIQFVDSRAVTASTSTVANGYLNIDHVTYIYIYLHGLFVIVFVFVIKCVTIKNTESILYLKNPPL